MEETVEQWEYLTELVRADMAAEGIRAYSASSSSGNALQATCLRGDAPPQLSFDRSRIEPCTVPVCDTIPAWTVWCAERS